MRSIRPHGACCCSLRWQLNKKTDNYLDALKAGDSAKVAVCCRASRTPRLPTSRARNLAGSVTPTEIALYVGLPGLYCAPTLALMSSMRTWGHAPALVACLLALPVAFSGHASERLVLNLACHPTSLLAQPTAIFHAASGVAIAAAYVQARALQQGP